MDISKFKKVAVPESPSEKRDRLQKFKKKKRSKYSNISCKCHKGHIHRSRFEGLVCNELHLEYHKQLESKEVELVTEKRFDFIVEGVKVCSHYMDFFLTFKDGRELAVEAKGAETAVWRIKKKLFQALYPGIEYEVRKYK